MGWSPHRRPTCMPLGSCSSKVRFAPSTLEASLFLFSDDPQPPPPLTPASLLPVLTRSEPYVGEVALDVLCEVADLDRPTPKRPVLPASVPAFFQSLYTRCVHPLPESRPTFPELADLMRRLDGSTFTQALMSQMGERNKERALLEQVRLRLIRSVFFFFLFPLARPSAPSLFPFVFHRSPRNGQRFSRREWPLRSKRARRSSRSTTTA